jgi:TRAP-type C4-dicarboxylate transport system substrate-binding protein
MGKKKYFLLVIGIVPIFVVASYSMTFSAPAAKPIVLKTGSTWEENLLWNEGLRVFSDMVAKESKGELTVKFIGGPETFPTFESIEILRKGVIDLLNTDATFYTKAVPAVFTALISELSPEGERKSGYFDAMNSLHQKMVNAVYLGKTTDFQFIFAFKNPVNKPDFSGLKIRGLPFSLNLIKVLGGSPIIIAPPELYSALEKGVVDGYGWPQIGHIERKFHEIVKYQIDHPYYKVSVRLLMNLDTWKKLPPHLQKLVTDLMPRVEKETCARHAETVKKEREELIRQGVKFITWSSGDVKKFYEVARKAGIEEAIRVSPDHAPELTKMIMK